MKWFKNDVKITQTKLKNPQNNTKIDVKITKKLSKSDRNENY